MNIAVLGMGFVGSVTAAVLADHGNNVIALDIDTEKIKKFNNGYPPIFEPGLRELILKDKNNLKFTTDYALLKDTEIIFICVPTPNLEGQINLNYVYSAIESIVKVNKDAIIVIKSTVVPGTGTKIEKEFNLKITSNPEFLREGDAIFDTVHPDRVVIGGNEEHAKRVARIWDFTNAPMLITTRENAELIKYANLCEKIPNTDVEIIANGMGYDKRIGPLFLKAGIGYGGSCFPKDTQALISFAENMMEEMKIVKATKKVNDERIDRIIKIINKKLGKVSGLRILQLGISFKENTNDLRESQAMKLYDALKKKGAEVIVYDPVSKADEIDYCNALDKCVKNVDLIVLATEWPEFKILENMEIKIPVIDGRRILDSSRFENYIGVGRYYDKD